MNREESYKMLNRLRNICTATSDQKWEGMMNLLIEIYKNDKSLEIIHKIQNKITELLESEDPVMYLLANFAAMGCAEAFYRTANKVSGYTTDTQTDIGEDNE
jgi:hypothetical protein